MRPPPAMFLTGLLIGLVLPVAAAGDPAESVSAPRLTDAELAKVTGKFVLPNGVELALSVTSDTVVNGQLILRTVLTVDRSTQLQVFGRTGQESTVAYTGTAESDRAPMPMGVVVEFDRKSGLQTVTPTFSVARGSTVTLGAVSEEPQALGLAALPLLPGGPAISTADGVVSLAAAQNGSQQVTFVGDQLSVVNLVGQSIATALANTANDRTLDSVTNVAIDVRNLAPYQVGMAQLRIDALAVDATRGMIR